MNPVLRRVGNCLGFSLGIGLVFGAIPVMMLGLLYWPLIVLAIIFAIIGTFLVVGSQP